MKSNMALKNVIFKFWVMLLLVAVNLTNSFASESRNSVKLNEENKKKTDRMGSTNTQSIDEAWLFSRFGLQADGTLLTEPENLQRPEADDANWRKLDLPHDRAIEGPFRIELKGETGKLPY